MAKEPQISENISNTDFKKLTEHILRSYLDADSQENMDILELLDDSLSVIGTGKQEFYRNLQEFSKSFTFEAEERTKIRFGWKNFLIEQQDIDETHVMVYGSVLILGTFVNGDTVISMDTRFTILYGLIDGKWKVLHIHHSVPNKEQMENEEFPRTLGHQIEESQNVIRALSNIYSTIIKVDIDTRCYEIFNSVSLMKSVAGMKGNFDETKDSILSAFMAPDMQEQMRAFLDFDTLAQRLQDVNTIAIDYKAPSGQWVQARFVVKLRDENGVAKEALYVVRDVSEEKAREQERQRKERELEEQHLKEEREHSEVISSLSTIYSTIFSANVDTHEYEILGSVPLMGKVAPTTGNFDDVKEIIIENFMEPEFREPLSEFLDLNTLAGRLEKVNTVTVDYKAPTGQWMQARFIAKRRDENGVAKEILYVARDITKEKMRDLEQQEALTHALTLAQQANKAKTTFLSSMSHDIRTPMNAIIGFTSLAQKNIKDEEQVRDYLGKISTSSTHLLSLINDILDMSRIESGTVKLDEKPVHIPDILHDLRTMIQGLVNAKNLNLVIDSQNVVHEDVMSDTLRLNQVLLNIVSNAVKFTQPGGDILVRLVEKPCKKEHYATYEFSVKDNGIGMSKEFLGHIFETFTREYSATVSGVQGTGLGMAITKNIVNMMGGDIKVESEEGKGSLFTVTLNLRLANEPAKSVSKPLIMSELQDVLAHPVMNVKIAKEEKKTCDYSGKRVLLVEDNELNREIATALLEETGMTIDSVEDGDEAVATINREPADKYDLIFMDVQMPRMDGYTATREIRTLKDNKKANIPIVAMTANAFEEDKRKAFESGMNGHIIKPISTEAIAQVLNEIFDKKNG